MTIPPDYFELREAAENAHTLIKRWVDERGGCDHDVGMCLCAERRVEEGLRKALAAGDEHNGIEIVAGDKAWPHRQAQRNIGHIALALDGGMKETT